MRSRRLLLCEKKRIKPFFSALNLSILFINENAGLQSCGSSHISYGNVTHVPDLNWLTALQPHSISNKLTQKKKQRMRFLSSKTDLNNSAILLIDWRWREKSHLWQKRQTESSPPFFSLRISWAKICGISNRSRSSLTVQLRRKTNDDIYGHIKVLKLINI